MYLCTYIRIHTYIHTCKHTNVYTHFCIFLSLGLPNMPSSNDCSNVGKLILDNKYVYFMQCDQLCINCMSRQSLVSPYSLPKAT